MLFLLTYSVVIDQLACGVYYCVITHLLPCCCLSDVRDCLLITVLLLINVELLVDYSVFYVCLLV